MVLGEKIQKLRKENNLSQEQLAEKLNISRQALSKWELGTSIPEVDKIILLSNYFKVTTDYLLKDDLDKEIGINQNRSTINQNTAIIISSAIVLIGLIIGWARANTGVLLVYFSFSLAAPGLIVQILGIACFEILNRVLKGGYDKASRYLFYGINIWFLAALPTIFMVGLYFRFRVSSYSGFLPIIYMAITYLVISFAISFLCFLLGRHVRKKQ